MVSVSDMHGRPLLILQFFGPLACICYYALYYCLSEYVHPVVAYIVIVSSLLLIIYWVYRYGRVAIGVGPTHPVLDLTRPDLQPHERVRFVCLSDTHSNHRLMGPVPEGDVLLHAGDLTNKGSPQELQLFNNWLGELPHKHKIVIAGNHDLSLDKKYHDHSTLKVKAVEQLLSNCTYVNNASITVCGYKLYGRPETPEFHNMAFNRRRGKVIKECWDDIPKDTNILLTHTPPYTVRDRTFFGKHVGCPQLALAIRDLPDLKAHVFGHIHESYGASRATNGNTVFINAAICNILNGASHKPIVFDLPRLKDE